MTSALHLTIRERAGGVLTVEIPKSHRDRVEFAAGRRVTISLEDDPAIRIRATIWGSERRYAVIRRDREHGDRFGVGMDVAVVA